ncbi:DUF2269 family protein [Kribbella antibiotica]|uniref:DUF2269 family protein n=1 Tax=Kribbella antibiotica TaxID=190195 RepID=A0A4R4YQ60_9ACTN|nr:DUF2269 family protein [Kribbella antibiotica]TDD47328.1 DUF2269 family protein [Kribbella antibiotica]
MTKVLLTLHVLAAILAVGPVAVAASMFPAVARRVTTGEDISTVRLLHRICTVYALVGIAVPLLGFTTANVMGVLTSPWLIASIILTAAAAAVLALVVLPQQKAILETLTTTKTLAPRAGPRLAMSTGIFNLLWAAVTVLMIVRPGSTTGA